MPNIYDGISGEKLVEEVNNAIDLRGKGGVLGQEQTVESPVIFKDNIMVYKELTDGFGNIYYAYSKDYIKEILNSDINVTRDKEGDVVFDNTPFFNIDIDLIKEGDDDGYSQTFYGSFVIPQSNNAILNSNQIIKYFKLESLMGTWENTSHSESDTVTIDMHIGLSQNNYEYSGTIASGFCNRSQYDKPNYTTVASGIKEINGFFKFNTTYYFKLVTDIDKGWLNYIGNSKITLKGYTNTRIIF